MIIFSLFLFLELCNAESEYGNWHLEPIRTNRTNSPNSMPPYQEDRTKNVRRNTTERSGSLFNKLPDALVDKLTAFSDIGCETAKFYNDHWARSIMKKTDLMKEDLKKAFQGLLPRLILDTMASLFFLRSMKGYFISVGEEELILPTWDKYNDEWLHTISAYVTEELEVSLEWLPFDSCRARHDTDEGSKFWHTTWTENHQEIIRGPIELIDLSIEQSRLSIEEDDEDLYAVQEIVNESNSPQKVILEKDIVTSLTISHTTTDAWNWQLSEELSVSATAEASLFGIGTEFTASASITNTNGFSGSSSDENSRSKEVSKIFRFELEAPPCSKITGRVSVTRETKEMKLVKTFKIGDKIVTIDGTIEQKNALTQRLNVLKTDQIENCKTDDTEDHCAIGTMDDTILPMGDHEWICSANKKKTVCRAICKNGNHDDDQSYKVYCNHSTTFWFKENPSQEILDCL
jgi:hypothetical protein